MTATRTSTPEHHGIVTDIIIGMEVEGDKRLDIIDTKLESSGELLCQIANGQAGIRRQLLDILIKLRIDRPDPGQRFLGRLRLPAHARSSFHYTIYTI